MVLCIEKWAPAYESAAASGGLKSGVPAVAADRTADR